MLVAENSNLVSKIVIGQSYENRPLNVLKVGHDQGCQVFTTKPAQLLLKTSSIASQGVSPGKNRVLVGKIHIC